MCGGAFLSFVCHRQSLFFPSHTERRDSCTRLDSLTPTAKSSSDLEHEAQSLPSDSAAEEILLQSLVADPHTRARIVAMLREDLTVVRSSSYSMLGSISSWSQTQTAPEIPLKSLPPEERSVRTSTPVSSLPTLFSQQLPHSRQLVLTLPPEERSVSLGE